MIGFGCQLAFCLCYISNPKCLISLWSIGNNNVALHKEINIIKPRFQSKVKIPIVGIGGVSSAKDVIEMMLAGATAVQVGAANLVNPYACRDIINDLPAMMEKYNIKDLKEIIGGAH